MSVEDILIPKSNNKGLLRDYSKTIELIDGYGISMIIGKAVV